MILHLNQDNFEAEVLKSDKPVLVDFFAGWCGPCRAFAPILEEFALENGGKVKVAKLNVDEFPHVAGRYNVESIPTVILFAQGREAGRAIGVKSKEALKAMVEGKE